ncbi:MAG: hypothetical protein JWR38_373 [Mucilaginibacter sp.]|nr:hypothetical protein [Mucilaginibacter sp.]
MIGSLVNMAKAQDTVIRVSGKGKLDSLKSTILNQERLIEVFTPESYKPGSIDKYDVLYVLDGGNWNTGLIAQIQRFLENESYMPPTIIVSILGIDRNKDLTPTHMDSWKTSGGADKFLSFIKNELIPYVNKTYPSNGDNTLWGHSLGGLFVMYAMLNEPKTFKSYIAVDPSLWWDNVYLPKMAAGKLPALANLHTTLYISGREGKEGKTMRIDTMEIVLKKAAPVDLIWKTIAYPDETHSSVRLKSIYDGLKFSYAGYSGPIEFHPMNGIVLKDKPIKIWYFADPSKVRYTIDGTEPVLTSAKIEPEVTLSSPVRFTAKAFTNRDRYNKSATGDFKIGPVLPTVAKGKNVKPGGFNYAYYEGEWGKLPDFKRIKPVQTGVISKDFDIDKLPRQNNFALLIDGQLETKEDGYYIFALDADAGSKLYLGNQLLFTTDSLHKHGKSYILPLAKGFYPFRVEYMHKTGDRKLEVVYITPGIMNTKDAVEIPLNLQYSDH